MLLFKTAIIKDHHLRFTEGIKMGEDLVFQYKYLLFSKMPVRIMDNLYYYRQRQGSAMANSLSHINNMHDNMCNAHEMLDYIEGKQIRVEPWLAERIHGLVKASIQSAAFVDKKECQIIKAPLHRYVKRWREMNSLESLPLAILLASLSMSIYTFLYRIIVRIK